MTSGLDPLPSDLASAHAMILAEHAARVKAEAVATSTNALIAHLRLEIEKLRRALYGSRSERKRRLLEQLELQLEDLEASASEDELAAEKAEVQAPAPASPSPGRKRPSRKPFPEHLPRERVVIPMPCNCPRLCRSSILASARPRRCVSPLGATSCWSRPDKRRSAGPGYHTASWPPRGPRRPDFACQNQASMWAKRRADARRH